MCVLKVKLDCGEIGLFEEVLFYISQNGKVGKYSEQRDNIAAAVLANTIINSIKTMIRIHFVSLIDITKNFYTQNKIGLQPTNRFEHNINLIIVLEL